MYTWKRFRSECLNTPVVDVNSSPQNCAKGADVQATYGRLGRDPGPSIAEALLLELNGIDKISGILQGAAKPAYINAYQISSASKKHHPTSLQFCLVKTVIVAKLL